MQARCWSRHCLQASASAARAGATEAKQHQHDEGGGSHDGLLAYVAVIWAPMILVSFWPSQSCPAPPAIPSRRALDAPRNLFILCKWRCRALRRVSPLLGYHCQNSFLAAVGLELRQVGPQVGGLLLLLDAGKDHLGAGHLGAWILDVFLERGFVPGDAGVLVGIAVAVALYRARLVPVQSIEDRTYLVFRVGPDVMARLAFPEGGFAGLHVLGYRYSRRTREDRHANNQASHCSFSLSMHRCQEETIEFSDKGGGPCPAAIAYAPQRNPPRSSRQRGCRLASRRKGGEESARSTRLLSPARFHAPVVLGLAGWSRVVRHAGALLVAA